MLCDESPLIITHHMVSQGLYNNPSATDELCNSILLETLILFVNFRFPPLLSRTLRAATLVPVCCLWLFPI